MAIEVNMFQDIRKEDHQSMKDLLAIKNPELKQNGIKIDTQKK